VPLATKVQQTCQVDNFYTFGLIGGSSQNASVPRSGSTLIGPPRIPIRLSGKVVRSELLYRIPHGLVPLATKVQQTCQVDNFYTFGLIGGSSQNASDSIRLSGKVVRSELLYRIPHGFARNYQVKVNRVTRVLRRVTRLTFTW
jgi:hypothetical protein